MERRRFLAATGIVCATGLTGCLGSAGPEDTAGTDGTPTAEPRPPSPTASPDTPTETPTRHGVTVSDIVVREAVTYESYMGSGGVLAAAGQQYVVASVGAAEDLDPERLVFQVDDQLWKPGLPDTVGARNRSVAGHAGGPIGRGNWEDTAFVAYAVPSPLAAESARIRLTGTEDAEWAVPPAELRRLTSPGPTYELESLSVPDAVDQGDPLRVSFTVRNVSETAGRFLGAFYWPTKRIADDDESTIVGSEVDAGGRLSRTITLATEHTTDETESVTLSVRGHVSADRQVEVRTG
ncbi:hypothetical protein ACKVMT_14540 [Halobacteriales archaeon Cl-PHB]